jgi:hypothetical protein
MRISKKLTIESNFGLLFWVPVGACFVLQALLSFFEPQNFVILSIALPIFMILYLIVKDNSLYNTPVLLAVLYVFSNVVFAFIVKTLLLQPANTNLYAPVSSYFATLVALIALFFSLFATKAIMVGKPLCPPVKDLHFLKWLSIYSFIIGVSAWVLNQLFLIDRRSPDYDPSASFGGFAIFDNLFYMSIISATAYVLIKTRKKRSLNIFIMLLFCVGVGMALVESRKIGLGFTFLSYILTCIFFRQQVTKKQVAAFIGFILVAFFVFTPIAHVYRSTLWFMPFTEKIQYIWNNYDNIFSPKNIKEYYLDITERKHHRYDYFNSDLLFLERFAAIQTNDNYISETDSQGKSKLKFYITDYILLLPSFIYPEKDTIALGDKLRWEYNLKRYGHISFSTAPLICNAYSVGKNIGVFVLCFYIFTILFLILKKINWNLYENVFAIFFLIPLVFAIHEKAHNGFITIMFREMIVHIFLFYAFYIAYQKLFYRKNHRVHNTSFNQLECYR